MMPQNNVAENANDTCFVVEFEWKVDGGIEFESHISKTIDDAKKVLKKLKESIITDWASPFEEFNVVKDSETEFKCEYNRYEIYYVLEIKEKKYE